MQNPVTNLAAYVKSIGKAYVYVASDPTTPASWSLLGITEGDIVVDEKFQYNDYKLPEWTGDAVHYREVDGQDIHLSVPLIWGDPLLYNAVAPDGIKGGGSSKPMAVVTKTVALIPYIEVGSGIGLSGTPLVATPAAATLAAGTSGSLASATYFVMVTALNAAGETVKSAEASVAVVGPNGSLTVTFPVVAGATGFRVYVGTAAGAENVVFSTTSTVSLVITSLTLGAGAASTAYNTPPAAARLLWTPAEPVHSIWLHKATFEPGQYHFKHGDGGKIIRTIGIRPLFDATKPEGQMLYTIGDPNAQGITTYRL